MGNKQSREAVSRKRGRGELVDGESDAVVTEGSVDADECDDSKALSPKRFVQIIWRPVPAKLLAAAVFILRLQL